MTRGTRRPNPRTPQSDDSLSLHRLLYRMQILNPQRSENFHISEPLIDLVNSERNNSYQVLSFILLMS